MGEPSRGPSRVLRSARGRILVTVLALLALSTLLSIVLLRAVLLDQVAERVDDSLVQEVDEFRALARDGVDPRTGEPFGDDVRRAFDVYLARNSPNRDETTVTIVGGVPYRSTADADDDLVARIAELAPQARTTLRREVSADGSDHAAIVVPVVTAGERRGAFAVAADLAGERDEVEQATRVAAGVSLVVLVLALVVASLVTGRLLAPLRELRDTALEITETDLTRRIAVRGDDEIADLGRAFNAMLDRLEGAFGVQQAFVSDAGHELRTPITIIRGHLELLGDDPRERDETIALVCDELDRMSRLVEDLLLLAKSERTDFLERTAIDLDLFSEELLSKARALGDRDWTLEAVGTGLLTADRQRLTQAVMNLAANAVAHTEPGERIAIGTTLGATEARIWVSDRGPGVPAGERERIFDRFVRGAHRARGAPGAGLGLAIVAAIAEAHDGLVELDSREGAGSTFTIRIPADPADVPQEVDVP